MTVIAQISDLHVQSPGALAYGVVDTHPLVARAIEQLSRLTPSPDAVVVSGDLTQTGTVEDYEQLKALLAPLSCPVYLMPGNHDQRQTLHQVFAEHTYLPGGDQGHLSYRVEQAGLHLVMLDSIVPGKGHGCVDSERLLWLDQHLSAISERPTLVFMHHPPFATGIPWMDRKPFQGREQLADLIRRHPQVKRISCGHLHRSVHCAWAGTIATSQPSLVHQSYLDFHPDAPSQFAMEPPAYQLHLWQSCHLISHTVFVGSFAGPFRFSDGSKVVTV